MTFANQNIARRTFIAGIAVGGVALVVPASASAQGLGDLLGLGGILGRASDTALNNLAQPGAFYNDSDIRIGLPMIGGGSSRRGGLLGTILGGARDLGVLDGLIRTLNDAAGVAAGEGKPIFRQAIGNLQVNDVPGIIRNDTGATQYLQSSAGDQLHARLMPLVDSALGDLGAYNQLDRLAGRNSWLRAIGISRQSMNRTVTDQGLDGIFKYIGNEERDLRANPLEGAGSVLRGVLGL